MTLPISRGTRLFLIFLFSWLLARRFWTRFRLTLGGLCPSRRFSCVAWPTRRSSPKLCPPEGATHMSRDLHCPTLATAQSHSFTLVIEINFVVKLSRHLLHAFARCIKEPPISNFQKSPLHFDLKFPCGSRGGLCLAVSCKLEGPKL